MSRLGRLVCGAVAPLVIVATTSACGGETGAIDGEALILDRSNSGRTDKFDIEQSSLGIAEQVLEGLEPGGALWVMGFSVDPAGEACQPLTYQLPEMGQSSDEEQIRSSNGTRLQSELPAYLSCLGSSTYGTGNASGTEIFSALVVAATKGDVALNTRVQKLRYVGDLCSTEPERICAPEVLADPEAATRVVDALDPALKPKDLLAGRTLVITTTPRLNPLTVIQEQRLHDIYNAYASTVGLTVVFE